MVKPITVLLSTERVDNCSKYLNKVAHGNCLHNIEFWKAQYVATGATACMICLPVDSIGTVMKILKFVNNPSSCLLKSRIHTLE